MIDPKLYEKYANFLIYDEEEGECIGLKEDAPKEAKEAYKKQKDWEESFRNTGEPIPR